MEKTRRRTTGRPFSIHMTQWGRGQVGRGRFRDERSFGRREEAPREGIMMQTLSFQVSVCVCVLIFCWAAFSGDGESARRFRAWYREQTSQPAVSWQDLRWEETAETMIQYARRFQALLGDEARELQPPLTGQGGMWPQEKILEKAAPDGASLSAYFLSVPAQYPVYGRVTCGYGWRFHPITGNPDFHNGMDIAAPMGSSVYTAFPGTVTQKGESSIYGNYIEITHGGGLRTVYCHCKELLAPEGANLRAGERIATVGSTGISTGPHLHFEVLVNGDFYDPAPALGFL